MLRQVLRYIYFYKQANIVTIYHPLALFLYLAMYKQKEKMGRDYSSEKLTNQTFKYLQTPQEQKLSDCPNPNSKKNRKSKGSQAINNGFDEQQDEGLNVSMEELKDTSTDKLSAVINQLIAKNKVNAKNAFEVPMIHLNQTRQFNSLTGDNNWKKISSSLESNNKIYGYRVDATHNHTYRILELLTRKQSQNKNQKDQDVERQEPETNFINFQNQELSGDEALFKHLEKNYKGINILKLQVFFSVNPILQKTKRIFDQQGLRGLLLNNIEIGPDLTLQLSFEEGNQEKPILNHRISIGKYEINQDQFSSWPIKSENIFTKIYSICCTNNLLQNQSQASLIKKEDDEVQLIWRQLQQLYRDADQKIQVESDKNVEENTEGNSKEPQSQLIRQAHDLTQQRVLQPNSQPQQFKKIHERQAQTTVYAQAQKEKVIQARKQENTPENQGNQVKTTQNQEEVILIQNLSLQDNNKSQIQSQKLPFLASSDITKPTNLSDPAVYVPKQVPIASEIRLSRKIPMQTPDITLKEIQPGHEKEHVDGDVVQKWKNQDKKPKVKRLAKKIKEAVSDQVDFIGSGKAIDNATKMAIMSIDKVRKLQFKKFMKGIHSQKLHENNLYIDTSQYKLNFLIKTQLREDQPFQQISNVKQQVNQSNASSHLDHNATNLIDLVDENSASQPKTVSIKYVKNKIQELIFQNKINSFAGLYFTFVSMEGYITPALCFLTLLHLTNQHGFRLQSERDDITIIDEKIQSTE